MCLFALVAMFSMNIKVGGTNMGKNVIRGRSMYMIHGGGVKRMNDLVNVFYTNAKSLQIFGRSPKLNLAQDQLQKEDIDVIAISEAGYQWNRSIEK